MREIILAAALLAAVPAGAKSLAPAGTGVAHSSIVGGLHNHPGRPKIVRVPGGGAVGGATSPGISGGSGTAGDEAVAAPKPYDRDAALAAAMARVDNSAQIRSQGLGEWRRPYIGLNGMDHSEPQMPRPSTADAPTSVTQY